MSSSAWARRGASQSARSSSWLASAQAKPCDSAGCAAKVSARPVSGAWKPFPGAERGDRFDSVGDRFAKAMTDHTNAAIITVGRTGLTRSAYKAGQQNDNHDIYTDLRNSSGKSCCNEGDCRNHQIEPDDRPRSKADQSFCKVRKRNCKSSNQAVCRPLIINRYSP